VSTQVAVADVEQCFELVECELLRTASALMIPKRTALVDQPVEFGIVIVTLRRRDGCQL